MSKRVAKKITKESDIQFLINIKKEDITYSFISKLFGEFDGKRRFNPYDEIIIPPNSYGPEGRKLNKTIYTTVGIWIFNKYFIEEELYDIFGYINETINSKVFNRINQELSYALLEDKITVDVMKNFNMGGQKFQPYSSILCPSFTEKMLTCSTVIDKKKDELLKKYKDEIEAGDIDTIDRIQKELLNYAREYLKDDPSMDLFDSGARGSFENNFKDMFVMKGAIANQDPNAKNDYNFVFSNYMDGISNEDYAKIANGLVAGPYYRAKKTESGGYWEKLFRNAFQHIVLLPEGSDCGTTDHITVKLTKDNIKLFMYCYIIEKDKLVELTSENKDKYLDKTVNMRFPNMCKSKNGTICNKCAGNLFYRLGIKNAGIALTKVPSTLKNIVMKNFHDSQVKLVEINPEEVFNIKS